MSTENVINNQRIAKNTFLLYLRTIFVLAVSLYTSRLVLKVLGVDDYGIYQVVGGMVTMFGILSNALSAAISRFITFELGSGNVERLKRLFSTSVVVQYVLAGIGLDRAMIGAYGHDDRVDAYPALMAEIGITAPAYTTICVLTDKEETGSDGVTGLNRSEERRVGKECRSRWSP